MTSDRNLRRPERARNEGFTGPKHDHQPSRKDRIDQSPILDPPCQRVEFDPARSSGTANLESQIGRFGLSVRVGWWDQTHALSSHANHQLSPALAHGTHPPQRPPARQIHVEARRASAHEASTFYEAHPRATQTQCRSRWDPDLAEREQGGKRERGGTCSRSALNLWPPPGWRGSARWTPQTWMWPYPSGSWGPTATTQALAEGSV